jgi:hypothetical protein
VGANCLWILPRWGCAQLLVLTIWHVQTVDANNPAKKVEEREDVTFSGPVDR